MSVKSNYIVIFNHAEPEVQGSIDAASAQVTAAGGEINHQYTMKAMKGFSCSMTEETKKQLESHPHVKYIGESTRELESCVTDALGQNQMEKLEFRNLRLEKGRL